jgi:hypothetical protein
MKWLLLMVAFTFPRCMYAASDCLPGDATADSATPHIYSSLTPLGGGLYVWCDVGNKWAISTKSVVGSLSEFDPVAVKDAVALAASTGAWQAGYDLVKARMTPTADDARLIAAMKALPPPTVAPPSGLMTTDVRVYGLSVVTNGKPAMSLVGTLTAPVVCDLSQKINGLYRINRSDPLIKYPVGAILPKTTWAKCD